MRTLFIAGEFPPRVGGLGDYTDRLAAALAARGDEVAVVTAVPPAPTEVANRDAVWAGGPDARAYATVPRWGPGAWRTIARHIRAERPDVVHLQYQAAAYGTRGAVALFPWLLRTWNIRPRFVTTFHDLLTPHLFPLSGRLGLDGTALRWLARGSDAVIATNGEDASALAEVRPRRLAQVPIGSNIAVAPPPDFDRRDWRAQYGVLPDDPLLAYFGFYNASKGLEELFRAFATVVDTMPRARLLLIGGGAGQSDPTNVAYGQRLRALAAELHLREQLIWTGYQDAASVSAHLLAADLVVLPFRDGVSLRRGTLMAALAHGCAIVTTEPHAPVPDLNVTETVSAVPRGDIAALAAAVTNSLRPDRLQCLRAAARTASERFTWPAIAAAHVGLYRSLCSFPASS